MPPQSIAAEWRARVDQVLRETRAAREPLDRELQQFVRAADEYRQAMANYQQCSAGASESQALTELAERAGRQQVRYARRNSIADDQMAVERSLYRINATIGATHLVIMAGKLAEIALAVYGAVTQAAAQAAQVGSQAAQLTSRLHAAEQAENMIRMTKPLEGMDVGAVASGEASTGSLAFRVAQAGIALAGFSERLGEAAKEIWEIAENAKEFTDWKRDGWAKAIAIVHIIRNLVSLGRPLIEIGLKAMSVSGPLGPSQATQMFYRDVAAGPLLVLGVLKDGIEAFQEFLEALESFKQMGENLEAEERQRQQGERYIGDPNVQAPANVTRAEVERLLDESRDYNSARVLGNAARERARQLKRSVDAAEHLMNQKQLQYSRSARRVQPLIKPLQELDWDLRACIAGYENSSAEFKREGRDSYTRLQAERRLVLQTLQTAQDAFSNTG